MIAGTGQLPVAGSRGAVVLEIFSQGAIRFKKFHHCHVIVRGEGLIERSLLDTLGQQFCNVAASVIDGLSLPNGFAPEDVVILQQCVPRAIHLDFQLDAEFVAVAQHGFVYGGQTRGPAVEVVSLVERTFLRSAVGEDQLRSLAQRPVPSPGAAPGFQNGAVETCAPHFVCGDQSSDSCAKNDHFRPAPGRCGQGKALLLLSCDHAQQAERVHRHKGGAEASHAGHASDEIASADGHLFVVLVRNPDVGERVSTRPCGMADGRSKALYSQTSP